LIEEFFIVKKFALALVACSMLALGLTGCPTTDTAASVGNSGNSGGTN
jgi:hypothetical protein